MNPVLVLPVVDLRPLLPGLSAERQRMEYVANNIANAYSTRTPAGGPFRRQDVVFSAIMDQAREVLDEPAGHGVP